MGFQQPWRVLPKFSARKTITDPYIVDLFLFLFFFAGSPCNNYQGYCDVFYSCRGVDAEGPLTRLKNLIFSPTTLKTISDWIVVSTIYSILFYPITLKGCQGTTVDFATIPFCLVLFSAALVGLAKFIPVNSLILSFHFLAHLARRAIVSYCHTNAFAVRRVVRHLSTLENKYSNISYKTTKPTVLKFHMEHDQTPGSQNCKIGLGRISKMAAVTKNSKNNKINFSRTTGYFLLNFGMKYQ